MSEEIAPQGAEPQEHDTPPVDDEAAEAIEGPNAAAAALAEGEERPTVDFRGITLELPENLPATLAFDFARVGGGNAGLQAVIQLLTSMLGEQQLQMIRNKIGADGDLMEDIVPILNGLTRDVFGAYGLTEGESQASDES